MLSLDQAELIRKAILDTSGGSPLIPENLSRVISERAKELSTFMPLCPTMKAKSNVYEWNDRTALPKAYYMGEKADPSAKSSTYNRRTVTLKTGRVKGQVTRFQRLAGAAFLDSLVTEIEGATEAMSQTIDGLCLWGSATADSRQYTGMEQTASTNLTDEATATLTIAMLDEMIDATSKGGTLDQTRAFWMSNEMITKTVALQRSLYLLGPMITLDVDRGWEVAAYRGIPLIPNQACKTRAAWSGTLTLSGTGTGGTLAADTYYFRMGYVDIFGEQRASASASVTTTGTTSSVAITWTAQTLDPDSETQALYYKIYHGTTDTRAGLTLYKLLAAKNYDSTGLFSTNVTSYTFSGSETQVSATQHPYVTGDETIFLGNVSAERGFEMPYLSEMEGVVITFLELARTTSSYPFQLESINAMAWKDETVLAVKRGTKST